MFKIGSFRFVASKPGEVLGGPSRIIDRTQLIVQDYLYGGGEPNDIQLSALDRDGRVVGTLTLGVNLPGNSNKEGVISEI